MQVTRRAELLCMLLTEPTLHGKGLVCWWVTGVTPWDNQVSFRGKCPPSCAPCIMPTLVDRVVRADAEHATIAIWWGITASTAPRNCAAR